MLLNVAHRERAARVAVGARAGDRRRGRQSLRLRPRRAEPRPPRPGAHRRARQRPDRDRRRPQARRAGGDRRRGQGRRGDGGAPGRARRRRTRRRSRRRAGTGRGKAGRAAAVVLSDLSIKRPVFAAVVAMLVAVVGITGFFGLSVREYPDVDPPVVSVETRYIGASASVIETRVTQVLEEQLAGIEGLQTITSRSQDGQSQISIEFVAGRNIDSAANDVRDRVVGRRRAAADRGRAADGAQGRRRFVADHVHRHLAAGLVADAIVRLGRPQPGRPLLVDRRRRAGLRRRRGAAGDAGLDPARAARRLSADLGRRRERAQDPECRAARRPAGIGAAERHAAGPAAVHHAGAVPGAGRRPRRGRLSRPPRRCRPGRGRRGESLFLLPDERRAGGRPGRRPPVRRQHARRRRRRPGDDGAGPAEPAARAWTMAIGSDELQFIRRAIDEVWKTLGRGGGARRPRHLPVPRQLAGDAHSRRSPCLCASSAASRCSGCSASRSTC